jgi:hypothetical protein
MHAHEKQGMHTRFPYKNSTGRNYWKPIYSWENVIRTNVRESF